MHFGSEQKRSAILRSQSLLYAQIRLAVKQLHLHFSFHFFSGNLQGEYLLSQHMLMNNCFHVVHDARPNFYVKLDLPSGKCYELSGCKRDSNSDAAVKAAATRSSVSAGGRCPSLPVAISCLLFFCSAETYPSWGWRGRSARE